MEIKASGTNDFNAVKALHRCRITRKGNPAVFIAINFTLCGMILCLSALLVFLFKNRIGYTYMTLCAVFLLYEIFLFYIMPLISYRSMAKLKDSRNEYTFGSDGFTVTTVGDSYSGTASIKYSVPPMAKETKSYIMIWQSKRSVFVVDKKTISGATPEELRRLLSSNIKKYIVCKY